MCEARGEDRIPKKTHTPHLVSLFSPPPFEPLQLPHLVAFVLALGVAVLAALVAVPWDGDVVTAPLVRDARATAAGSPLDTAAYTRRTVTFPLLGGE